MNKLFYDVLICGAGIIGSALALRLAQSGLLIAIVDHNNLILKKNKNTIPDSRVSAINYASVNFFKKINIWKDIPSEFLASYHYLKVWECPISVVTFNSNSIGLSEMGFTIENNRLKSILWKAMINSLRITLYCPSILVDFQYNGTYWQCTLNNNIIVNSWLLIGADGTYSKIRERLGIGVTGHIYNQYCMLLTIKTEYSKQGTIWQIFTPRGPIGFLPLYDRWGSLMWFDTGKYIRRLQCLPKLILEKKIKTNFYKQLGECSLHNILIIPLLTQQPHYCVFSGGVLIGDSAHTIHPLAGQGINLGIRDVMQLSKLLIDIGNFKKDVLILQEILQSYQNKRKFDVSLMQNSINWLHTIFHNNFLPLKITRNLTFMMIERLPYIKRQILRYAVGVSSFIK
ncbi:2-octaprenyl-3-methyl-6-methoxy-1,4-benzoquinol hydroxylase [Candidatus Blochmanniella vafra str. BVAF]|uniref:2-octaprenyl-3-methyl-6-methoxy-1,4-benzoquinol hydroxylase n=1 Tax=Blochmanniella vafra (strain BVAF) TaxID=859654 RepID=E8Q6X1_BLOVB|nr:FAD-dependent monooxygenase [Candidatus Blochmannia vafer]ADV33718.1 2-octaprenyl-3-methyl-6-methoxy-1,4-benzoquinol hydroxylase [Candidatus Blochmannia vafer str. BVAF]